MPIVLLAVRSLLRILVLVYCVRGDLVVGEAGPRHAEMG